MWHKFKKNINLRSVSFVTLLLLVCNIYANSFLSYQLGGIFFGEIKPLYNIKLAHFFYKRSAYPILNTKPKQYAHYQLSRVYFIEGDLYSALDEANNELKIYPTSKHTYYILGLIYGYLNKEQKAIDAFSKYIESHPDTWAGRNDKAWLQFRIGDIDGAITTILPVVERYKYTPWVQNTYCALLINKKDYVKATEVCADAKKIIDTVTEEGWGRAYPGNDPRLYSDGLQAMKKSIRENILILEKNKALSE
jgi:tetratricopeptide (TPR) repeat protein